jgi:hypothetical protein
MIRFSKLFGLFGTVLSSGIVLSSATSAQAAGFYNWSYTFTNDFKVVGTVEGTDLDAQGTVLSPANPTATLFDDMGVALRSWDSRQFNGNFLGNVGQLFDDDAPKVSADGDGFRNWNVNPRFNIGNFGRSRVICAVGQCNNAQAININETFEVDRWELTKPVPEPTSILSLLALGAVATAAGMKRKLSAK